VGGGGPKGKKKIQKEGHGIREDGGKKTRLKESRKEGMGVGRGRKKDIKGAGLSREQGENAKGKSL